MFSFVVFDSNGAAAKQWTLRHAYLFGPDDLPVPSQITFDGGVIRCSKQTPDSAGLSLQYTIPTSDGTGEQTISLKTCLLPPRPAPYLLSLELARFRIMLFLNKLEDWGLTDLSSDHPVMKSFEEARQTFTRALVAQRAGSANGASSARGGNVESADPHAVFSAEADQLARRALALALEAGETLALLQAGRQGPDRASGKLYADAVHHYQVATSEKPQLAMPVVVPGAGYASLASPAQVGVTVGPNVFADSLQKAICSACDFISMPMRWIDLEPSEGQYSFAGTDRWIEWAVRTAKLPIHAGPLIDFRPSCTPEWLYIWENDYETVRDLVIEHLQNTVTRYRRTVARWTACSGLHVNTHFRLTFEQIMDLTKVCLMAVRKLHPAGKVYVEIAEPWGEYHAFHKRTLPPLLYAEALNQSGLSFDGFALRVQMGQPESGQTCRDLMALSALLDRYAAFEKPIAITAAGVPSSKIETRRKNRARDDEPLVQDDPQRLHPGAFVGGYTDQAQAEWLGKALSIMMAKPYVQSVCWQELVDYPPATAPEMAFGGLVTGQGVPKPACRKLAEIRQAFKEARSPFG